MTSITSQQLQIKGKITPEYAKILTLEAQQFLVSLHHKFEKMRQVLLQRRVQRQKDLDQGKWPDFLPETQKIRESDWKVAPIPKDLEERKTEITGPVDRKMIINALNSGADVFMADFEDSNCPTWDNNLQGQFNLFDAVRRSIQFTSPEGKAYKLNDKTATLVVRPRGWHLYEKHVLVDGKPMSGSLFDFGLYFFHNAAESLKRGTGPYFYLPKMESHLEARLWHDVFVHSEETLGIRKGSIRATVLIETILAAFEMDEILYELRDYSSGLNCGRWDYIFSFIKKFRNHPQFLLPDRSQVTMDKAFLKAYVELLIKTCHRRGIHAMGGMAAQIPIKNDNAANEAALEKVRQDKLREVKAGHDGTWVAHPGLVSVAKDIFDEHMPGKNQLQVSRSEVNISTKELLEVPKGEITEKGFRHNINVGILYLESWLRGIGCVPIYNLMEDAATVEISRSQIWQWLRHGAKTSEGTAITQDFFKKAVDEELNKIKEMLGAKNFNQEKFALAAKLFIQICTAKEFPEFLTLVAYDHID